MLHPVIQADIDYIARNMRYADRMEVAAASGLSPRKVLTEGVDLSSVSKTYTDHRGTPVFIVGVMEPGIIWLLGTDEIHQHRRTLHRLAGYVLNEWHERWPRLSNLVDARNTVHIRWLKSMGFQFDVAIIAGVAQIPFIPFYRDSKNV